jgi:HK97 family phage major capsid protein
MKSTKEEIANYLAEAQSLVDDVERGGRTMTRDEKARAEFLLERVKSLKDGEQLAKAIADMNGSLNRAAAGTGANNPQSGGSGIGFDRDDLENFKEAALRGRSADMNAKATLLLAGHSGASIPDYQPGVVSFSREQFRVRSLFPIMGTDAPQVNYQVLSTGAAQAAAVAEGAAKPEATVVLTQSVAPVRKIAVFLPISDEAVLDGAAFFSDILDDLVGDLIRAENAQILSGSGVAPNIEGLTVVSGTQTQARGTDTNMDAVLKAQTKLRTGPFLEPTNVVLNPVNFETVRLAKGTDGTYILGNPLSQDRPSLGGARLHVTTDIAAGTGLVMNSAEAARVYLRSDVRVEIATEHGEFFRSNLRAIVAEERLTLAVRRPSAIVKVTGLN